MEKTRDQASRLEAFSQLTTQTGYRDEDCTKILRCDEHISQRFRLSKALTS